MAEFDSGENFSAIDQFGVRLEHAEQALRQFLGFTLNQAHPGNMRAGRQKADKTHHPLLFAVGLRLRDAWQFLAKLKKAVAQVSPVKTPIFPQTY